ncbi:MAG: activator of (R)-2-hydroxyglutaryl-CoA dehydratase [Acidobacteria bacterium]|nr:activator of (R)-2-hydroxyglutaryl-CoA dehydratase [Acidobacteriota bacterium]
MKSKAEIEHEIRRRVDDERRRLEAARREPPAAHFHRPVERPFTAAERNRVTILFGGLTWKHEWLIRSAFQSAGYKVELLPVPDVAGFQLGKEFGNNGQCNPTYFMTGHLIKYLQGLEAKGLSRQQIVDDYVFFTAGSCGPCRFGMYEAEYRLAVENAGFRGFRVLLFQQDDGINAASGEAGLKFGVDFGLGAFNALNFGDVLNDVCCQIRPYEVQAGETERVAKEAMERLSTAIRERRMFHVSDRAPAWLASRILANRALEGVTHTTGKIVDHLWGRQTADAMRAARERLAAIDVDRLRVKPLVKVTGEFFAQTTEGDGNFHMFQFLEREGAEIKVEPIANWIMYLLWQAKARHRDRRWLETEKPPAWALHRRALAELAFQRKQLFFGIGEAFYAHLYRRVIRGFGGIAHQLLDMQELARLAQPYYHRFARGGEGHLEVAKNIYYTVHRKAHMVLSLKPFGCMPSTQSDGTQSAVMNHFKDMIFLPIETSGEGEINAHSRVQMALGEAKAKARLEFQQALDSTGRSLDDIREFVAAHPELRRPFYHVPHARGVTGTAAHFVLHVGRLMDRRRLVPVRKRTPRRRPLPPLNREPLGGRV